MDITRDIATIIFFLYVYNRSNYISLSTWIGLAGPGSPGPSIHMCWWLFSGGNLEQFNAVGQGKPKP